MKTLLPRDLFIDLGTSTSLPDLESYTPLSPQFRPLSPSVTSKVLAGVDLDLLPPTLVDSAKKSSAQLSITSFTDTLASLAQDDGLSPQALLFAVYGTGDASENLVALRDMAGQLAPDRVQRLLEQDAELFVSGRYSDEISRIFKRFGPNGPPKTETIFVPVVDFLFPGTLSISTNNWNERSQEKGFSISISGLSGGKKNSETVGVGSDYKKIQKPFQLSAEVKIKLSPYSNARGRIGYKIDIDRISPTLIVAYPGDKKRHVPLSKKRKNIDYATFGGSEGTSVFEFSEGSETNFSFPLPLPNDLIGTIGVRSRANRDLSLSIACDANYYRVWRTNPKSKIFTIETEE